jgi:hypothetical protein
MKEEDKLIEKFGKKNQFKVPEGYFENFTNNLMDKLPPKEIGPEPKITTWQRIKPWIYMTAMFCGLMLSVKVIIEKPENENSTLTEKSTDEFSDAELEIMIDNTMTDDYSLYTYITGADNNISNKQE